MNKVNLSQFGETKYVSMGFQLWCGAQLLPVVSKTPNLQNQGQVWVVWCSKMRVWWVNCKLEPRVLKAKDKSSEES